VNAFRMTAWGERYEDGSGRLRDPRFASFVPWNSIGRLETEGPSKASDPSVGLGVC